MKSRSRSCSRSKTIGGGAVGGQAVGGWRLGEHLPEEQYKHEEQ
jgi:hypothetical protein